MDFILKKKIVIGALFLGAILLKFTSTPFATAPTIQSLEALPGIKKLEALEQCWFTYRRALKSHQVKEAQEQLEQLYQLKLDLGIRNLFPHSLSLLREAREASRRGDRNLVLTLTDYAQKLSPQFSKVHFALAAIYWSHNKLDIVPIGREIFRGVKLTTQNFVEPLRLLCNGSLLLLGALLGAFMAFLLLMFLWRLKLIHHNLVHLLPRRFPPLLTLAFFILLLTFPLLLGLNPIWTILYWMLLVCFYLTRREKTALFLTAGLLSLSPFLLNSLSPFFILWPNQLVEDLVKVREGPYSSEGIVRLGHYLKANPRDFDILFSLGLVSKKLGNLELAEGFLSQAKRFEPQNPLLINNLGNIALASGQTELAAQLYRQAIECAPQQATFYHNLAQAYRKMLRLNEASSAENEALRLDREAILYYDKLSTENLNRIVIDEELPLSRLWMRVANEGMGEGKTMITGFLKRILPGIPAALTPFIFLVLLALLLVLHLLGHRFGYARECCRCGTPHCPHCLGEEDLKSDICPQCSAFFVKKVSYGGKRRFSHELKVRGFARTRRRTKIGLNLILPGSGYLLSGFPFAGLFYLLITFLTIIWIVLRGEIIRDLYPLAPQPPFGLVVISTIFAIFYLFSQWSLYKKL